MKETLQKLGLDIADAVLNGVLIVVEKFADWVEGKDNGSSKK